MNTNKNMNTNKFIADRLREVYLNGKWVANTNYKEQLENLNWQQAIQKVGELNSIALLTFHINYYLKGLLNVFNGGALEIRDKFSFEMKAIESQQDWEFLKNEFLANAERFANHVEKMNDEKIHGPFIEKKYGSYLRNIEGVIEHSYYHLGQISLIKKMIKADLNKECWISNAE